MGGPLGDAFGWGRHGAWPSTPAGKQKSSRGDEQRWGVLDGGEGCAPVAGCATRRRTHVCCRLRGGTRPAQGGAAHGGPQGMGGH
eukprot:scaffold25587_cov107-Isochrysis_galbana.AAC.2